jgi:hypothetical protein
MAATILSLGPDVVVLIITWRKRWRGRAKPEAASNHSHAAGAFRCVAPRMVCGVSDGKYTSRRNLRPLRTQDAASRQKDSIKMNGYGTRANRGAPHQWVRARNSLVCGQSSAGLETRALSLVAEFCADATVASRLPRRTHLHHATASLPHPCARGTCGLARQASPQTTDPLRASRCTSTASAVEKRTVHREPAS